MALFSVSSDIMGTLRTWVDHLRKLTFTDNFRSFEWEGEIAAGKTVRITHSLKVIPTRFIVLDNVDGSSPVFRPSDETATADFFFLACASAFKGKVLILP
jgi:hypothetical protein